jgi:hypothetical protein
MFRTRLFFITLSGNINCQVFEDVPYGLVLELEICILRLRSFDTFSTDIVHLELIKYVGASCFRIPRLFLHRLQISTRNEMRRLVCFLSQLSLQQYLRTSSAVTLASPDS